MQLLAATATNTMTPEFMGLLVLGLMQLGNFWFNAAKNRRDEAAVTKAELKEVELRLDAKIIGLERRVERKTNTSDENIRDDFKTVFAQLEKLNSAVTAVTTSSEVLTQKTIAMEGKIDVLNSKVK